MSKSEDYLDNLLSSVSPKNSGKAISLSDAGRVVDPDKAFLDEFEKQLMEDDGDDQFLRDFEKELAGDHSTVFQDEKPDAEETVSVENVSSADETDADKENLIGNLDNIVNSAKRKMQDKEESEEENELSEESDDESEFVVDTLDDDAKAMIESNKKGPSLKEEFGIEDDDFDDFGIEDDITFGDEPETEGETAEDTESNGEDDDVVSLLQSEDDFAELGNMIKEKGEGVAESTDKEDGKKKDSNKKEGFFAKLKRILFGEDEDEENTAKEPEKKEEGTMEGLEGLSDENLDILKELEGSMGAKAEKEPEEEPKDKKEKKKKEKKPKEKKEKKPKVKKEKKPKPPKEKDNTPPLPKVPVILIFVMAASFMLLILLGSKVINYSSNIKQAQSLTDQGKYTEAYAELSGMDVKDKDTELYEKTKILAAVSSQYEAAQVFIENEDYDMALDSLICAVGRYDINYSDAETYNCTVELNLIEQNVEETLSSQFAMTADQARELYATRSRKDYTVEVYKVIQNLGLEKVTEE